MFGFRTQCQCQCQYLLKKFKITYTRLTAISIQYVPVFEICHKVTNSIQPSTHTVCWIFSIRCHYLGKKSELPIQEKRLLLFPRSRFSLSSLCSESLRGNQNILHRNSCNHFPLLLSLVAVPYRLSLIAWGFNPSTRKSYCSIKSCNFLWTNSIRCHCLLKALVDLQVSGVSDR